MPNKISIVTSLYNSAPYIEEFHRRHVDSLKKMNVEYEFIFVNDGSPDNSKSIVTNLAKKFPSIKLISLSRNFGQHRAMFAGMEAATGELIYATDSDLEELPENIEKMYQLFKSSEDVDVVYGVTSVRTGGFVRKVLGKVFYLILDSISTIKIPHDQTWQRIMSRQYVQALLRFKEIESLPAGLMVLTGFKQIPITVEKTYKGTSSYSFTRRLVLAINSLISFSSRPITMICLSGMAVTVISSIIILVLVVKKLTHVDYQAGWISLLASIWCIGGMILTSVGVIGIYTAKIFNEVKDRPRYVVDEQDSDPSS